MWRRHTARVVWWRAGQVEYGALSAHERGVAHMWAAIIHHEGLLGDRNGEGDAMRTQPMRPTTAPAHQEADLRHRSRAGARPTMSEGPEPCGFRAFRSGSDRRRSGDLSIFSRTLYQLSYRALGWNRPDHF